MIVFALGSFRSMGVTLNPPPNRTHMSMQVRDISGLVVGSSIQLRGVPIGEINNISTTITGATVDFAIDNHYKIPVDTDIRLETLSALGEAYVELIPRSEGGPVLQEGQLIATEAVRQPPTISELATTVVRVLNQFDPAALDRIVNELDAALPNPTDVLPNLANTAVLVRNTVANMNGKGRDLLDNFQALLHNAQFVGPVLAFNAPWLVKMGYDLARMNDASVVLHDRGAPQTLHNLSHLVGRIEHFLDHSGGDLKVLMQTMLPYLNDTSGALMNLDTAQVFGNLLAAVPEDGAVTLHVTIPDNAAPDSATADAAPVPAASSTSPAAQTAAPPATTGGR